MDIEFNDLNPPVSHTHDLVWEDGDKIGEMHHDHYDGHKPHEHYMNDDLIDMVHFYSEEELVDNGA